MAESSTLHFCTETCFRYGCPLKSSPTTVQPVQPTIQWFPCGGGVHDFAVGESAAICNRCEKVVPLDTDDHQGAGQ